MSSSYSSSSSSHNLPDDITKAKIVHMILNRKTEEALQNLSEFYNVTVPRIVVGTIKGKRRTVYAVYVQKESRIHVINSDIFYNPFIVLHEFYHHIRTRAGVHRGSEKHANMYAQSFVDSYKRLVEQMRDKKKVKESSRSIN
ncbi:MAG TPA: hypothetical protein VE818_01270 [Nitrososphaeraceae archaeon]|jgi:hypothetical protein|nr:hypothetical protein [Nitrososphaeraceae archaeon]